MRQDQNANHLNPLLNLPTDLHCYICSFLLGELFNNSQDRTDYKLKFSTTRKSHLWFQQKPTNSSSSRTSVNFPSHDGYASNSQLKQFYLNSPLQLNEILILFSLKNTCRKMFEFVSESEELWHSVLISFPLILNFRSGVERTWMMRKNSEFYSLFDFDQIDLKSEMVDDILNILFLLNKLCRIERVVKRISIDFSVKTILDMRSRFSVLNIPHIIDENPFLSLISVIFESLEELILLPSNMENSNILTGGDLIFKQPPFRNLKRLVIDTDFSSCIEFVKIHLSTLEFVTFINKQNNFKTIYTILIELLEKKIMESDVLKSVEFVGPIDLKYLDHIQREYTREYNSDATKYLSKINNLSIFQFSSDFNLGTNHVLISNMVELTLVQFQGGDILDLRDLDFPNLKILNMKGCMQSLVLQGMKANSLESMQLRMFELSGIHPVFYALKFLTIDYCKGVDVVSWFNDHINLKSFIFIPNKMENSLLNVDMKLTGHGSISLISVTGCESVNISQCKNLEEIYLIDCKQTNISTSMEDSNRGLKILEIEYTIMEDQAVATMDLSYCYYMALRVSDNFQFNIQKKIRIDHLDLLRANHFDSIKDFFEISNIYIADTSIGSILSVVNCAKVKKQFGITHLSKYLKPIRQFELLSSEESSNIVSSALLPKSDSFPQILNLICTVEVYSDDPIHFGQDISLLCFNSSDYRYSINIHQSSLFCNIMYLSLGRNISQLSLDLSHLPNLIEFASMCRSVSLQATDLIHTNLRSLVLYNADSVNIKFNKLIAPKLIKFIVDRSIYGTETEYIIEIVKCEFSSLIFHSSNIEDKFVNGKVKSLAIILEGVKKHFTGRPTIETLKTQKRNNYCKIM